MAEVREMPPTKPARDELEEAVASMLVRIDINYRREGTGWGSRFEGERLEVVQARAVIRRVREADGPRPVDILGGGIRSREFSVELEDPDA